MHSIQNMYPTMAEDYTVIKGTWIYGVNLKHETIKILIERQFTSAAVSFVSQNSSLICLAASYGRFLSAKWRQNLTNYTVYSTWINGKLHIFLDAFFCISLWRGPVAKLELHDPIYTSLQLHDIDSAHKIEYYEHIFQHCQGEFASFIIFGWFFFRILQNENYHFVPSTNDHLFFSWTPPTLGEEHLLYNPHEEF